MGGKDMDFLREGGGRDLKKHFKFLTNAPPPFSEILHCNLKSKNIVNI